MCNMIWLLFLFFILLLLLMEKIIQIKQYITLHKVRYV